MAIAIIRRYNDEDRARVIAAVERFVARHDISGYEAEYPEMCVDHWINTAHPEEKSYRRKLWTGVYCRALRVPFDVRTTVGWGYIGVEVK